ncbi:thiamine ABC transporter substrate-binding protein [Cellulomonas fengjieae]|uniref:Thiamine ABC transporter substrate-binding protein n=1 Tax=Cellulomonas fengjieae TaxID=2819978 RepID=A0ABS3SLG7_9CELL|nr:thiamine ABC transporter substrate-binding protein [Cellulomonas fengjieae]MBO3086209.1 thiamine ABC transporter substrate-binding protein [Cellulomonas fengjieae]QVI65739.1 thiamine ABC transporter substrate-binding protein [Cellulomonas fengjieae]
MARIRSLIALAGVVALAGCSAVGSGPAPSGSAGTVTLVTHDSFALSDGILDAFEEQSGLTVDVVQPGDGGALVNQLVLTKDAPLGDLVFGIDNSFASRAVQEGVVAPTSTPDAFEGALVPVDYGDVCINVDHAWFAAKGLAEPVTLQDLALPQYKDLLVVPNAVTSSPGLSFLLATIGAFGEDGWQDYWTALKANGLKVADGWSDAYYTDFSGGGAAGPRPLVVSYASSPPYTVPEGGTEPTTGALLDTCFRQTEYAGVLDGAANADGAQELLDFLLSDEVQEDIPGSMYMYPVSPTAALPEEWAAFAPLAADPFEVDPAQISANREAWLTAWSDTVIG